MATNGTTTDGSAQVSEISIDLLAAVDQTDSTRATVSIPHERAQTVQATVRSTDGGRWRCDFHVNPSSAGASQPIEERQMVHIGALSEWVTPVLNIIEALMTEAGC